MDQVILQIYSFLKIKSNLCNDIKCKRMYSAKISQTKHCSKYTTEHHSNTNEITNW